eukprot:3355245-Amphidinium_carterae.1
MSCMHNCAMLGRGHAGIYPSSSAILTNELTLPCLTVARASAGSLQRALNTTIATKMITIATPKK